MERGDAPVTVDGGQGGSGPSTARDTFARHVTDWLEPRNWILALTLLVGWGVDGLAGVGWGVLGACFAAVLPVLFIRFGIRRAAWADRHLGVRRQRLAVMLFIVGSVLTGTLLMSAFGAPAAMVALIAAMVATLVVLMALTVVWKVSVHAAVSSGSVLVLTLVYGSWALLGYPLVALVAWSRVALRGHTCAQVVAGTVLGALVAGLTFAALR